MEKADARAMAEVLTPSRSNRRAEKVCSPVPLRRGVIDGVMAVRLLCFGLSARDCKAMMSGKQAVKRKRLCLFPILELVAKPSHVVDITRTFEAKLNAMWAYRSQHEVVPGIPPRLGGTRQPLDLRANLRGLP